MKKLLLFIVATFTMMLTSCETSSPETDVWYAMKEKVKSEMKNPSSFEEDSYNVTHDHDDVYDVTMDFYGTNSFGAKVLNHASAKARWSEHSTTIYDFYVY